MKKNPCLFLIYTARTKVLILFLLFMAGKGFSQSSFNYEVNHPSVNAEQFNIGASAYPWYSTAEM